MPSEILSVVNDLTFIYAKRLRHAATERLAHALRGKLVTYFQEEGDRVSARIRRVWPIKTESLSYDVNQILRHVFDVDEESVYLEELLIPLNETAGRYGQKEALRQLSLRLAKKVIYRGSAAWIRDNAIRFGEKYAREISVHTNDLIRDQIARGIENGEGVTDVVNRIEVITRRQIEDYRAEIVARTEMGRAYNMSKLIQERVLGLEDYDWGGCDPGCLICGPFMGSNPHTAEEIENFVTGESHPNCAGDEVPRVPADFVPNALAV